MFLLQLFVLLIGPQLHREKSFQRKLPLYFTAAAERVDNITICTYPLLSTIFLGIFAMILTAYLFWLGSWILKLVIKRVCRRDFLPLRVLLLGVSVLIKPDQSLFQVLVLLAFFALFCCACDIEARRRVDDDHNDTISLIANQSHLEEESGRISPSRNSDASKKRGSISFRTFEMDGTSMGTFVELSLFSPSRDATPPGSPPLLGWPMRPPTQVLGP
ncbi:hypothetical protein RGQ29_013457 [Quercus rubra]|uniref:Uncharacterized protein n=1 Tax=Quercus rubra TaxID=3512 RepID=A0AAN7G9N5_QUERU|nr:hypothetical protein RGQ29_013457 [Quercus rubra]